MSSTDKKQKRAIEMFEEAFERLKRDKPINLPPGSPVSQNNVAREAGRDPSALRSDRYPLLLQRIKSYIASEREKAETGQGKVRSRNRKIEERLADCTRQRDRLRAICYAQQELIDELKDEVNRLKEGKVVDLRKL